MHCWSFLHWPYRARSVSGILLGIAGHFQFSDEGFLMNYLIGGFGFGFAIVGLLVDDPTSLFLAAVLLIISFFWPESIDKSGR